MSCPGDQAWRDRVLDFLWEYHPKRLSQIVQELGIASTAADEAAKNYGAWVIEALLAAAGKEYEVQALAARGVSAKTVRMPQEGRPYEAMSFPAFDHEEFAEEDWETSRFRLHLNCLLIITLYGRQRVTPFADCTLGHAFFWRPDEQQERIIRGEWARIRDLVKEGRVHDIPTEAATNAIHVRPHGKDSSDVVADVRGRDVVRSCLWLNKNFVREVVVANR